MRRLCSMWVGLPFDDLKVSDTNTFTQPLFGQHTKHCLFNYALRESFLQMPKVFDSIPPYPSCARALILRVSKIVFVPVFFTCFLNLLSINHNDIISHVHG